MVAKRVLIFATSHDKWSSGEQTGLWAEELIVPYYIFKEAGLEVDIASVKGGKIPIDAGSLAEGMITEEVKKFLGEEDSKELLEKTISVKDLKGKKDLYDAIFLPGGHGVCFDVANDKESIALMEAFWAEDKVVASVCHGPCAFSEVKGLNGDSIVKDRKVTGFSNTEEEAVGKTNEVPFLLEDKLKELGGKYEKAADWQPFAVRDGKLITGQNPASSAKVAHLILESLA